MSGGRPLAMALLLAVYGLLFLSVGVFVSLGHVGAQTRLMVLTPSQPLSSSAREAALQCHQREHAEWQSSQHAVAMQEANDKTVLGDFDGATFSHGGVTSTFYKKGRQVLGQRPKVPDGKLADFEIRYTFGVSPLAAVSDRAAERTPAGAWALPGTRARKMRAASAGLLSIPIASLTPGDPLHWTGIDQNWNYQCAFCHSTNLKKNYDPHADSFHTTWSEISVGCEACHGPASHHVAWASKTGDWQRFDDPSKGFAASLDERKGVTWSMAPSGTAARSEPRKSNKEIEACAACHARRQQFSDDLAQGHQLLDAFRPALLEPGLYHADGQQRDEVYTYASFLQSRMHAAGVTCSDCHNPHTQKLRAPAMPSAPNATRPQTFDTPTHHHHAAGSKGAECAACHMPTTTYMVVDPRHDHSMRIPRPDRTLSARHAQRLQPVPHRQDAELGERGHQELVSVAKTRLPGLRRSLRPGGPRGAWRASRH